jgi:hypothetical protein
MSVTILGAVSEMLNEAKQVLKGKNMSMKENKKDVAEVTRLTEALISDLDRTKTKVREYTVLALYASDEDNILFSVAIVCVDENRTFYVVKSSVTTCGQPKLEVTACESSCKDAVILEGIGDLLKEIECDGTYTRHCALPGLRGAGEYDTQYARTRSMLAYVGTDADGCALSASDISVKFCTTIEPHEALMYAAATARFGYIPGATLRQPDFHMSLRLLSPETLHALVEAFAQEVDYSDYLEAHNHDEEGDEDEQF